MLASARPSRLGLLATVACVVASPALARAASLQGPVAGWGSGVPAYVSVYEYVPDRLAESPPILVAAHYCNGSASALFGYQGMPAVVAAADTHGFIIVFPQTTNTNSASSNCWDVGSDASLTRDGGGDTHAIAQMVQHQIDTRGADPDRVYVMGVSSGAMMTQALLAVYPDVFKAGSAFSGVPAGCWANGYSASSNWSEPCAQGMVTMTSAEWGALVEEMNPGYAGYRPRIQLWHGTADTTIDYANHTEAIKEWTNVLGLDETPNSTDTPAGYTVEKWQNTCGFTVLEAHTQEGGGHSTPIDADAVVSFFGLDQPGPDPQIAVCGPSGNGGSGGTGGSTVTGTAASATSTDSTTGGSGGSTSSTTAAIGSTTSPIGSTASAASTGANSTAAATTGPGSSTTASASATSNSSTTGSATTGGLGGASGTGSEPLADEPSDAGCDCRVGGGPHPRGALGSLPLALLGALVARRARRCRNTLKAA